MMISGPRMPLAGPSNAAVERPAGQTDCPEMPPSSSTRSFHHGTSPPSRFELHISLTTFPPIVIPSSTPRLANSRAAAPSKRYGFLPLHSNESTEAVAEHIPRDGTLAAPVQYAIAPDHVASARMKL